MKKNNGGPAFPAYTGMRQVGQHESEFDGSDSMTLRDYFAAKAIEGICAHPDTWGLSLEGIVSKAYTLADLALRARGQ